VEHLKRIVRLTLRTLIHLLGEIGLLVIAFTPIDAIVALEVKDAQVQQQINGALFRTFTIGIVLVIGSYVLELLAGFWKDWEPKKDKNDG